MTAQPGATAQKWYILAMLALSNVLASADRSVVSAIAEPLKMDFHLSDKQIGLLSGIAFSATYALAVLPMGYLIDRINRRALLSVAIAIWSVLTAICALSGSFMALVLARMGVGAAEAPGYPTCLSLIGDSFPAKQRTTAVSIYVGAGPLGAIATFAIGAQLMLHYSWRAVFLVVSAPGLILALLLFLTMREPRRGATEPDSADAKRQNFVATIRSIAGDAVLRYAIAAITVSAGVIYALTAWSTSFLVRIHHFSVSQGAIATGLGFGLGMSVSAAIAGPVTDRIAKGDQRKLALIATLAILIAVGAGVALALGQTAPLALAGLNTMAVMAGIFVPCGYSIILSLAAPESRGTTMSATMFVTILLGTGLVPLVTGTISDAVGGPESIRPALLATASLLLLNGLFYLRLRSILARRL